jgi:RimJ/RimL family protein N-acetyltransferase
MPWIENEPLDFPSRRNIVNGFIEKFNQKQDFTFGIFSKKHKKCIGSTGLHTRLGEREREIGYWIHTDYLKNGYATEAVAALTKVAFEVEGLSAVEIHCHRNNITSAKIPQKLGYQRVNDVNSEILYWRIEQCHYATIPAFKDLVLRAYDSKSQRLL